MIEASDEERRPRHPSNPGLLRHWGEDGRRSRGLRGGVTVECLKPPFPHPQEPKQRAADLECPPQ
eukprot:3840935-Amphidinium_carterae.1